MFIYYDLYLSMSPAIAQIYDIHAKMTVENKNIKTMSGIVSGFSSSK